MKIIKSKKQESIEQTEVRKWKPSRREKKQKYVVNI